MKLHNSEPITQKYWLPILVGFLLLILVAFLWNILNEQEQKENEVRVELESQRFLDLLEADMGSRIPSLQRMVSRWEIRGGISKEEFLLDAMNYFYDWSGFQAIEWVDHTFFVRWIAPIVGNEQALDLDLAFEEHRRKALQRAKDQRQPSMSDPITLVQGGKGFLVYFPIYIDNEFAGFILAVFHVENWLNSLFLQKSALSERGNYLYSISIDGENLFEHQGWSSLKDSRYDTVSESVIMGHLFTIRCKPTASYIKANSTIIPEIIAGVGSLIAILIAFIVYLSQKTTIEAWRTHVIRTSLESEIINRKKTEVDLSSANNRLVMATKAGNIGVWVWDVLTDKLDWNDLMFEMYEIPPDVNPTYETWRNRIHPDDLPEVEKLLTSAIEGKALFENEFRITLPNDDFRIIRAAARVKRDETGKAIQITGVNWDITSQKETESLLEAQRERLEGIMEGTNVGTWEWNVQTGACTFNQRWADIIGYTLEELAPVNIDTWEKFAHPEDLKLSEQEIQKHFNNEISYYEAEARMKHKNGEWVWVLDRGKITKWTDDGKPLIMSGTHADISKRKKSEAKILHMASHDALTNLPGLRLARDRIEMAINLARRNKEQVAVLFIDLDGFKAVNDTYGHDAGDEVLKTVATRLLSCVRATDTIARIGGDEFLMVLTELTSSENVEKVAKKAITILSESILFGRTQLKVGASIGISIYPVNGDEMDTLIKKADNAMYKIKKSGKNNYIFA